MRLLRQTDMLVYILGRKDPVKKLSGGERWLG